jgi:hypothetical protein
VGLLQAEESRLWPIYEHTRVSILSGGLLGTVPLMLESMAALGFFYLVAELVSS